MFPPQKSHLDADWEMSWKGHWCWEQETCHRGVLGQPGSRSGGKEAHGETHRQNEPCNRLSVQSSVLKVLVITYAALFNVLDQSQTSELDSYDLVAD